MSEAPTTPPEMSTNDVLQARTATEVGSTTPSDGSTTRAQTRSDSSSDVKPSVVGVTEDSRAAETQTPPPAGDASPVEIMPTIAAGPAPDVGEPTAKLAPVAVTSSGEHEVTVEEALQEAQKNADQGRAVVQPTATGDIQAVQANPSAPISTAALIEANPGSVVSTKNKASEILDNGGLSHDQIDSMSHLDLQAVAETHGWSEVRDAARGAVRAMFKKAQQKALDEANKEKSDSEAETKAAQKAVMDEMQKIQDEALAAETTDKP